MDAAQIAQLLPRRRRGRQRVADVEATNLPVLLVEQPHRVVDRALPADPGPGPRTVTPDRDGAVLLARALRPQPALPGAASLQQEAVTGPGGRPAGPLPASRRRADGGAGRGGAPGAGGDR